MMVIYNAANENNTSIVSNLKAMVKQFEQNVQGDPCLPPENINPKGNSGRCIPSPNFRDGDHHDDHYNPREEPCPGHCNCHVREKIYPCHTRNGDGAYFPRDCGQVRSRSSGMYFNHPTPSHTQSKMFCHDGVCSQRNLNASRRNSRMLRSARSIPIPEYGAPCSRCLCTSQNGLQDNCRRRDRGRLHADQMEDASIIN